MRMKPEEWDAVIATNLTAAFTCTQAVLRPMLKQRWGRVISVGSVVGQSGNPGQVNYAASKAGLIGFSKALAREVAARGITVNVVAPGFIETDMTARLDAPARGTLAEQIPAGRLGLPEDVAAAVSFLASGEASYITGQIVGVNGGMYM
jgi:3-oxoacyl-[acyl-carrier protein] reductase